MARLQAVRGGFAYKNGIVWCRCGDRGCDGGDGEFVGELAGNHRTEQHFHSSRGQCWTRPLGCCAVVEPTGKYGTCVLSLGHSTLQKFFCKAGSGGSHTPECNRTSYISRSEHRTKCAKMIFQLPQTCSLFQSGFFSFVIISEMFLLAFLTYMCINILYIYSLGWGYICCLNIPM